MGPTSAFTVVRSFVRSFGRSFVWSFVCLFGRLFGRSSFVRSGHSSVLRSPSWSPSLPPSVLVCVAVTHSLVRSFSCPFFCCRLVCRCDLVAAHCANMHCAVVAALPAPQLACLGVDLAFLLVQSIGFLVDVPWRGSGKHHSVVLATVFQTKRKWKRVFAHRGANACC